MPEPLALCRALEVQSAVLEFVVRRSTSGRAIAYVVLGRPLTAEELAASVTRELPGVIGDDFVLVDRLPRLASGDLDMQALSRLPVGLEELARRLERGLRRTTTRAAVLALPNTPEPVRLHVWDLAPAAREDEAVSRLVEDAPAVRVDAAGPRAEQVAHALTVSPDAAITLPEALERAAARFHGPRMLHLSEDGSEHPVSFAALCDEARRVQAGLVAYDVRPARFVILQLTDTRDLLACFWGALFAGAIPVIVPVPASYDVATGDRDKLAHVYRLLDAPLVVTSEALRSDFDAFARLVSVAERGVVSIETLRRHAPARNRQKAEPDDVAFLSLSSGSTGAPKCIQLTHRNILARGRGASAACGQSDDDVVLNWLPFDHIGSISDWHLRCVDLGCYMVYAGKERVLGRPLSWLDLIERHRVTHSWAPNFAYALINAALDEADASARWDLSSLKSLLTAGEAVASRTVTDLIARLAPHGLSRTAIRPAFGMAELGSGITYFEPHPSEPIRSHTVDRATLSGALCAVLRDHPRAISFTCLGPVIAGMAMRIVDEDRRVLPEATIGHLHVRGDALSPGYYRDEEANRLFLDDGWFDTGDQGFLLDGQLYLTGRSKDCLILDGANYFPSEIESAAEEARGLMRSFTAAYTVRPKDRARECLALFFVPELEDDASLRRVTLAIQERIAHKVKVKVDYFVPLAAGDVPKTAIGKIQRSALAARFEAGAYRDAVRRVDLLLGNERTLPDFFARARFRPAALPTHEARTADPCIVIAEDLTQDVLAERLAAHAGARRMLVLDLRALAPCADPRARPRAVLALLACLSRARGTAHVELTVATRFAQAVEPEDCVDPFAAQIPPLLTAAARDAAWLEVRCVDFGQPSPAEEQVLLGAELASGRTGVEVAYRGRRRFTPAFEDVAFTLADRTPRLAHGGMFLVVGGLGGIGRLLCARLLSRHGASLLIVGRRPLGRPVQAELEGLSALGPVRYAALDACDSTGLEALVREAENATGRALSGIFHFAGIAREGDVFAETGTSLASLSAAKLDVARALTPLLSARPGSFVVHASSLESAFPSASTGAYAAACRALEVWSHHERTRLGIASYALAFSAWNGVGMSRAGAPEALLRARGMLALDSAQALLAMEALLGHEPGLYAVGVAKSALPIRARTVGPAQPLVSLRAFVEGVRVEGLWERDREGRETCVPVERVSDMVITPQGEVEREALFARFASSSRYVAPTSELERDLCALFQRVLGVEQVGVHDGFFDLGGTSLAALRLFGLIESRHGVRLPASTLYDAPSVRALAGLLGSDAPPKGSESVFPLTSVRPGPALFLVHDADGETLLYGRLARLLQDELPVYAIRPEGRDGVAMVQTRIDDMASHYVAKIRALQPEGPYFLGGLCSGGVVAFAIAQKLEAMGERVGLVALLDSADAKAEPRSHAEARGGRFMAVIRDPSVPTVRKLRVMGEKLRNVTLYEARRRTQQSLDHASFLLLRACVDRGFVLPSLLRRVTPRMIYHFAHREYEPGVLEGPLALFRASERLIHDEPGLDDTPAREQYHDPMLGWTARTTRLELVESRGGHSSMLREPHVSGLATALRDRIRAARHTRPLAFEGRRTA